MLVAECSLHKAAGTCTEKIPKWYFEPKEKRCIPFYYSGCGGNGNHFDSLEECNDQCPVKKGEPPILNSKITTSLVNLRRLSKSGAMDHIYRE